jgi:uncharacterized protein (TIGR00369 family)
MSQTASPREWGPPRTRTVTWFDVSAIAEQAAGLTGAEWLQGMIDGRFPPPPISSLSGSRLISIGEGECVFGCTPHESFLNPIGLVHGGLLCTVMDSAMGIAVTTTLPSPVGYATIELKVSFIKPLPYDGREVIAHGKALRVGRRIAFAEAHAYDADGTLIGHATSSLTPPVVRE